MRNPQGLGDALELYQDRQVRTGQTEDMAAILNFWSDMVLVNGVSHIMDR